MWKDIWSGLRGLAGSKKFQAAVISGLVWGLGKLGLSLSAAELTPIVAPLWVYVFGQALADIGKERAKIEAARQD